MGWEWIGQDGTGTGIGIGEILLPFSFFVFWPLGFGNHSRDGSDAMVYWELNEWRVGWGRV